MKKPVNALVTLITGRKPSSFSTAEEPRALRTEPYLRAPHDDGERLQRIAVVIESVAGELARLEYLRSSLEGLRDPISTEFDTQMKAIAQAAELNHRLGSANSRLAELDAERTATREQLHDTIAKLERSAEALEAQASGRHLAEQEVAELRPILLQAREQADDLARKLAEREHEHANLLIESKSLSTQLEKQDLIIGELSGRAERLQHDLDGANDQLGDARKRGEALQARALRAERVVDDLNGALTAERDRVAELEARLQAVQAAASRTVSGLQAKDDERLMEIANLKNRLSDVQTRCASLEESREKTIAELHALNAERNELGRDAAAREVDLMQLRNRVQSLTTQLDDAKRRVVDVDLARTTAVQRSDGLAKQLTGLEGRFTRSEIALEQKSAEADTLKAAIEELRAKLAASTQDLQAVVVQQKSEIDMLRGALGAMQKSKPFISESN